MDECEAQISSVLLQRGPYLGTCPVYDVTLRVDGAATWNGGRLVDRLGSSEAQIDVNDYNRLASFIERARFVGCKLGGFMSHQAFRGALASLAGATSPVPAGFVDLLGTIHTTRRAAQACLVLGGADHAR